MSDTIEPTEAEASVLAELFSTTRRQSNLAILRAHVAAEVAKAMGERDELLEEIFHHTANLSTYPDGPCMDREYRDQIKKILAARAQQKGP